MDFVDNLNEDFDDDVPLSADNEIRFDVAPGCGRFAQSGIDINCFFYFIIY